MPRSRSKAASPRTTLRRVARVVTVALAAAAGMLSAAPVASAAPAVDAAAAPRAGTLDWKPCSDAEFAHWKKVDDA